MTSMVALADRRVSAAAEWGRSVSAFALVLLVTACVGHRYGLVETLAFFWVLGLVAALALSGLGLAAWGFYRLWTRGDRAGRAALTATLLAMLVLAPYLVGAWLDFRHPTLTDISTDLIEPPRFVHTARARTAEMNPIAPISQRSVDLQLRYYPRVSGRRYEASMVRVLSAVTAVIGARGWRPYRPIPEQVAGREISIEVEAPSFLVRLPADAVIRLSDEGESTFVDMRMSSRYADRDLGENARRIRRFMNDLDAEFTRQSLEIIDIPPSPEEEAPVE